MVHLLNDAMMPTPRHLAEVLQRTPGDEGTRPVSGPVVCPCGSRAFHLFYPGSTTQYASELIPCTMDLERHSYLEIQARCTGCDSNHMLFDSDLHGFDAVITQRRRGDDRRVKPIVWACSQCKGRSHSVNISITPIDKTQFFSEFAREFDENMWPEMFEWITINIRCQNCHHIPKTWVSFETA